MNEHTPEPWGSYVLGQDGITVYQNCGPGSEPDIGIVYHTNPRCSGDARRIVACVNACAGLSTEALEAGLLQKLKHRLDHAACAGVEYWPEYIALAGLEVT